jgi:hypothetical protein
MREAEFQRKLIKALKAHPAMREAVIWKIADRFGGGRPDLQIINQGRTTYYELKKPNEKPTKLQQYYLDRIGESAAWIKPTATGEGFLFFWARESHTYAQSFDECVEIIVKRAL